MPLTEQDIKGIRAVVEQDAEAVRRADWAAVTRMFTVDAVRYPPHQPPVRGRDAMRAWLETFPPIQQFSITADEIVGCDDLAFVRGTYTLTVAPEPGAPEADRGHYMGLLRKQADGSWLWATDMVSSELPFDSLRAYSEPTNTEQPTNPKQPSTSTAMIVSFILGVLTVLVILLVT